jgi:hypothetical protein
MILYDVEYEIKSTGHTFICKVVGDSRDDVINDIVSQVGEIRVNSVSHLFEVHRITGSIRRNILENSLRTETKKVTGRPRKYELMGN